MNAYTVLYIPISKAIHKRPSIICAMMSQKQMLSEHYWSALMSHRLINDPVGEGKDSHWTHCLRRRQAIGQVSDSDDAHNPDVFTMSRMFAHGG